MLRVRLFCIALFSAAVIIPAIAETPPAWVTEPDEVYPSAQYLTALGTGASRKESELNALEALAAIFNRSINAETKTAITVQEKKSGSNTNGEKTKKIHKDIAVSTKMDNFVGAEIKEVWQDAGGTFYALAVMNKTKAASLYLETIRKNNTAITELTGLSDSEKYTINGYCRYNTARLKAVENEVLLLRLMFLNAGASAIASKEAVSAASLQLACADIAQQIPIALVITGDKSGKIKAAFGAVFSGQGFTTAAGNTGRYRLRAALNTEEPVPQGSNKIMLRYTFEASLEDTKTGEIMLPFALNGREIHFNQTAAESKLMVSLEKKIKKQFAGQLTAYLRIQ